MSNTPRQPRPDDAVLGGQYQAPIDGAVLGGIEGLRQRLASDNLEVKKVALTQALNYGEKGVEVLFEVLDKEKNLDIQWFVYQIIEKQNNSATQIRLKNYFPCYEFESVTVNRRGEIIQRTPGKARYFREDLGNGIYLDMTYIPGGTFLMGTHNTEIKRLNQQYNTDWFYREYPQHQVIIPPFWIGKYAITQEQWQTIMGNNPSCFSFKGVKRPVENVSWYDCQKFCQTLSQRTGTTYGLPSEAQWEYACRSGTITPFSFGETITSYLACYRGDYTYADEGYGIYRRSTVEVGSLPPNGFGLYEMHGNVWEWCGDAWHDNYKTKPQNLKNNGNIVWLNSANSSRIMRGNCWSSDAKDCRSACRLEHNPINHFNSVGFRLAFGFSYVP